MRRALLCLTLALSAVDIASAQGVAEARLYNEGQFSRDPAQQFRRSVSGTLTPEVVDRFAREAGRVAGLSVVRSDVVALLVTFERIWDEADRLVAGATARHAERLATVPPRAARAWAALSGADVLQAAFTLVGLNSLWSGGRFDEQGFDALMASVRDAANRPVRRAG